MNSYEKIRQLQDYGFHPQATAIYFEMVEYCSRAKYVRNRVPNLIKAQLSQLEEVLLQEHGRLIRQ